MPQAAVPTKGGTGGLPSTEIPPLRLLIQRVPVPQAAVPHEKWRYWSVCTEIPPLRDIQDVGASIVPEDTAREFSEFLSQSEALHLPGSAWKLGPPAAEKPSVCRFTDKSPIFRRKMYIRRLYYSHEPNAWGYTGARTSTTILGHKNRRPIAINHEGFSMMLLRERCIAV